MNDIKVKKINKKTIVIISIVLVAIILVTTVICLVTRKEENIEVENTGRIQKQAMNPNNYTMVKSKDGIDVPVPKGYTASSVESESYVNGTFETLYLNKNLTDTFTSEGTYPWSKNDSGIWTSGNYNIDSSTSEMTSEEFTVSEDGGILQLNWTVSSQLYYDYLYGEIINITTNSTEKTTIKLNGPYYATKTSGYTESDLIYMNTKIELNQGTYKLKIIYNKNASTNGGLDKGYVKEVKIYDRKNNGNTDTIQNHKYGGFYIGRYEVGDLKQTTPVVKRMNTDIVSQTWYTMYKKCKKLSGTNTNVTTSMLWGTQYDQVMNWLIKSGEKTPLDINKGSVAWGNYSDVESEYYTNTSKETATKNLGSGTRIASGAYEGAKANNIYDLAGNVWLWTLEANSSGSGDYRYNRGGAYNNYGVNYCASGRSGSGPSYRYNDVGFSGELYIK